ncbi:hypothetical protein [Kutzneria sp. NPDC052558]|uniref:hypothetical protein n=1 Tax=Kutzneria sp. NPDC052558 TaxID=3364121 RepID=UPI0037C5889A
MKHSSPDVLEALDSAWDDTSGFLGLLRSGKFLPELAEGYLRLLSSIEVSEGEALHPDFVRLVWFVPLFMEWQVDRNVERGANKGELVNFLDLIRERIMEILGVP